MSEPANPPSRIRNAAADSAAMPLPTRYAFAMLGLPTQRRGHASPRTGRTVSHDICIFVHLLLGCRPLVRPPLRHGRTPSAAAAWVGPHPPAPSQASPYASPPSSNPAVPAVTSASQRPERLHLRVRQPDLDRDRLAVANVTHLAPGGPQIVLHLAGPLVVDRHRGQPEASGV